MIENRELIKFYTDIQQDVKSALISDEEGNNPEQIFTDFALSLLSDAGETENYRICYDEKISKRGIEHKVNAYALYENYETLDLFITIFVDDDSIKFVTKTDAQKAFDRITNFYCNVVYKDYINILEESSEIFDIAHTLSNVEEIEEFLTRVNIFLVTNGEVKSDLKSNSKIAGYPVFYRVIDLNYLFNLSEKSHIPIEIDFFTNNISIPCINSPVENEKYKSYLAIIPGSALTDIYEQFGPRLLEQNVRSFLQFTGKINKGIRRTILEEQHMFLAFNNGIAATAEEVRLVDLNNGNGKAIGYVKDFQIVNGGQTTASIYHTWKKNKADISKIFVPLKLTIINDSENFAKTVGRIAEYANTQNKVSASDLSSNRENHILLEKLSRTIWAPPQSGESVQTRWFFERSRGQYKNEKARIGITPARRKQFDRQNPRKQMFTKEMLAKFVNSWHQTYIGKKLLIGPHYVVRGSQKNYAQFLNHNFSLKPDNVYFEDVISLAILFKTAEKLYGIKPNSIGDMRYITVPYSVAWLGYKINYKLDLYGIWKKQGISAQLKEVLFRILVSIENFIRENAPGSLYGEWAKKEECWKQVQEYNFEIDLTNLSSDLQNESTTTRRKISNQEIDDKLVLTELNLIKSIPVNKWTEINKLSRNIKEISQHLQDRAINIMSTLKLKKSLSESQRKDAMQIIDIIVNKAPDFFDDTNPEQDINVNIDSGSVRLNKSLLIKIVEWDTKAKVLSEKELQYVAQFAYGLKNLNSFHENNIRRQLEKLIKVGFNI